MVPPPLQRGARGRQALHPARPSGGVRSVGTFADEGRTSPSETFVRAGPGVGVCPTASGTRSQTWTRRPEGALLHQSLRGRLRSSLKTRAGRTSRAARIGIAPQASGRAAEGRSWPANVRARPRTTNAAAQTISACSTTLSEIGCTPTSKTSTTTKAASTGASPPRRTCLRRPSLARITTLNLSRLRHRVQSCCSVRRQPSPASVSLPRFIQQPSPAVPESGLRRSPLPRWVSRALRGPSLTGVVDREVPVSACTELLEHPQRDLGSDELWARSLARSRLRRSRDAAVGPTPRSLVSVAFADLSTGRLSSTDPIAFARTAICPIRRSGMARLLVCGPNAALPSRVSSRKPELPAPHSSLPPSRPRSPSKALPTAGLGRRE